MSDHQLAAERKPIDYCANWDRNPRLNQNAIPSIAESIRRFGFVAPVVVWKDKDRVVAGHTRIAALKSILAVEPSFVPPHAPGPGLIPVREHPFRSEDEANAYAIADNKLAETADWDVSGLIGLLQELDQGSEVDIATLGWGEADFDALIASAEMPAGLFPDGADLVPDGLPQLEGAGDDRAKTVVLVYTNEIEAGIIKDHLGLEQSHNFDNSKMFPVRDLWGGGK